MVEDGDYVLVGVDGKEIPKHPGTGPIVFECPACDARHTRGFVNGIDLFRCLRCGYSGHGFHTDRQIDTELFEEWKANNAWNRQHGIAEVPLGVDPLGGPG